MTIFNRSRNRDELHKETTASGADRDGAVSQSSRAFFNTNPTRTKPMVAQSQPPFALSFDPYTRPIVPPPSPVFQGSSVAEPGRGQSPPMSPAPQPQPVMATPQDLTQSGPVTEEKDLIIKRGITLKGEISSCDRVLVHGTVEALLSQCGRLEVLETGVFRGCANVKEAAIAGRLEGAIVVDGTLVVLAGSHIHATVHYGKLRVEEGATITGELKNISSSEIRHETPPDSSDTTSPDSVDTRPDVAAE